MDVGESPLDESMVLCCATTPGTMAICSFPAAMVENAEGKLTPLTVLIEGGNKGSGMNVPLCEQHKKMYDKNPASIEFCIPPSELLPPMRFK